MTIRLHVFPPSPRAFKVLSAAAYLRLDYEVHVVDLSKGEHRTAAFAALNPNQRMPVLEEDGFVLWESNAILQYLALKRPESGLLPADGPKRCLVQQWQFWDLAHWDPACTPLIFERCVKKLFNLGPPDAAAAAKGEESFHRCAQILDGQLKTHRFVAGDALTVADFSVGAVLNLSQMAELPLQSYPAIASWHKNLTELPGWRKSMVSPPANAL
jgi:glutathione S-transferase